VSAGDFTVRLDTQLPGPLPVGRGTAIFCLGACFHRRERVRSMSVLVDGIPHKPAAWGMPRLDTTCYRSGFWATLRIPAREGPGTVDLSISAVLESGARVVAPLGSLEVVAADPPPDYLSPEQRAGAGLIAICMATFDPDIRLFRTQIQSLREQTDRNWVCLISDDFSTPERFAEISETVGDDARFFLSRAPRHLGYYRNFERALGLVPREAHLVALCDHDDRWYPEKLEVLRRALGGAQLVYSDQRLVDANGGVLRETFWDGRRNNHTNLASLLVANTITGAATLFRRELAELALPFPDTPGWQFHDHWLALVALASGEVAYVDRALYDYVQHPKAVLGQASGSADTRASTRPRGLVRGWRARYFYGYVARQVQAEALLARCSSSLTARKRRVLERFAAACRSPLAFAWLAARPLRSVAGANETLGTESELARGILWRYLIALRTRRRETPGRSPYDASCPPLDANALGEERLARWRARV
jgi:hypothetical protein